VVTSGIVTGIVVMVIYSIIIRHLYIYMGYSDIYGLYLSIILFYTSYRCLVVEIIDDTLQNHPSRLRRMIIYLFL